MVQAAKESSKALGVADRQALIVCHNDEPHPHVHVIVNRVSMEDGRAANMRGDHLKLSRWAESWERRHGKVYCGQRVGNNERRNQGEFVRGTTNLPRAVFEAIRDGLKGFNDNREARQVAAELKADQQRKAAELVAQGREMHRSYRQELADLAADYRRNKAKIIEANRAKFKALQAETRTSTRQAMQDIWAQQRRERQTAAWGNGLCSGERGTHSTPVDQRIARAPGSAGHCGRLSPRRLVSMRSGSSTNASATPSTPS